MRSFTPESRSASQMQACEAAMTFTPNSRSSGSIASMTGQCGEGEKDRVGLGMRTHQRAAHVERRRHRNAAELVDDLAKAGRAENLAAVAFGVGDQSRILARAIGMSDHHFLAGE